MTAGKPTVLAVVALAMMVGLWTMAIQGMASNSDAEKGKRIYMNLCARCHGLEGKGDGYTKFTPPVADLTSSKVQGKLNIQLFRTVHEGKPNTAMGAWKVALSDQEIWDVLAYVRTLAP